jgi:Family of unknown function (DUF6364)
VPKLTLSVDGQVVGRAKRFAEKRGTSVSQLVERYLQLLTRPLQPGEDPPVLRRLKGALKGLDTTSTKVSRRQPRTR